MATLRWLRDKIKDSQLADSVPSTQKDEALTPLKSRRQIKEAIERRYTGPARGRNDCPKVDVPGRRD